MLARLDSTTDSESIGFFTMEHLKLSGIYWALGSYKLLGESLETRREELIAFVKSCQHKCGGFGGNVGHDPHITTSLYALLVMGMLEAVDQIDTASLASYVQGLQNEDGSFSGDHSGEVDTRFSYCAVSALSLLNKLDTIDRVKTRNFILSCKNIDGAFGGMPGAESHAAYVFTAVGALKILGDIDLIDLDKLGMWLSQR